MSQYNVLLYCDIFPATRLKRKSGLYESDTILFSVMVYSLSRSWASLLCRFVSFKDWVAWTRSPGHRGPRSRITQPWMVVIKGKGNGHRSTRLSLFLWEIQKNMCQGQGKKIKIKLIVIERAPQGKERDEDMIMQQQAKNNILMRARAQLSTSSFHFKKVTLIALPWQIHIYCSTWRSRFVVGLGTFIYGLPVCTILN